MPPSLPYWQHLPVLARTPKNDPTLHRSQIIQDGHDVEWSRVARCPCRRVEAKPGGQTAAIDEHRVDCAGCYGTGWIKHSAQPIKAIVQVAELNPQYFRIYGMDASGMARVTVLPEHLPAKLDHFRDTNQWMVYSENLQRTSETVQSLRYPVAPKPTRVGTSEADHVTPVDLNIGVIYCRRTDATGALVAGELVEDVDFEVTAEGAIDWTLGDGLGTAPADGAWAHFEYHYHPVWVARVFPFVARYTYNDVNLPAPVLEQQPVRVDCWLEHLGDPWERLS